MKNRKQWLTLCLSLILPLCALAEGPVYTQSVALTEGAAPTTFSVYATGGEEIEPVYRIEYALPGGAAAQPLSFPCLSLEQGVPLLRFVDLNFDGRLDLGALYAVGATNETHTWFLQGEDGQLTPAEQLGDLSWYDLYPVQKLILNFQHDSAVTGIWTLYRCEDGQARVYRRAEILYDDRDASGKTFRERVIELAPDGSETVLLDETGDDLWDEEQYKQRYEVWQSLLWQGLDASEKPLPRE